MIANELYVTDWIILFWKTVLNNAEISPKKLEAVGNRKGHVRKYWGIRIPVAESIAANLQR